MQTGNNGPQDARLEVADRRVWVQSREDLNFPQLTDYGNNRYGLRFTRGRHGGAEWMHWLISEDAGLTWMDDRSWAHIEGYHGTHIMRRRDGSLLGIVWDIRTPKVFGEFWGQVTSHDHGRSWAVCREPAFGTGPMGGNAFIPWNAPIELADGTLLAIGSGPVGASDPNSEVFIFRRPTGETMWRHGETSVFGPQRDTTEGTNEACLAILGDGRIGCVSRTGYPDSPLLWTVSHDQATTWSKPIRLPFSGVDPKLYVRPSGQLVLIFGARQQDMLHGAMTVVLSDDHGEHWSDGFVFYDGPGSSYHTSVWLQDDTILVCYCESQFRRRELPQHTPPGQYNRVCAVQMKIKE